MADVADLERLLERVFERTSARLFRSRVQAVQVERRVERVMEAARSGRGQTMVVPWRYRLRLHPADLDDLAVRSGGGEALAARVAAAALGFARAHGYHLARKPVVDLAADPTLERGRIEVDAVADDAGPREFVAPAPQPRAHVGPSPTTAVLVITPPEPGPAPEPPPEPPPPAPEPSGPRADPGRVAGIRRAAVGATVAVVRVTDRLGRDMLVEVGPAPVIIGRATECAVSLLDAKISRQHGRLELRRGALWYTDLGSRNGSRVNGTVMDEAMLAAGDRLALGECVLVVESLPA